MSELKLNAIDFISFAVAGNTFKLKANLIGPNDQFHSVNLDIAPDEIKNKTCYSSLAFSLNYGNLI